MTVVTSDIRGAGTDATVYIQIFGEKEDSGTDINRKKLINLRY